MPMDKFERMLTKIKKVKNRQKMIEMLEEFFNSIKEENELLRLQLLAREKERDEYKKELDEIHQSISYRVGRWIAETKWGSWLKKILRKYIFK